LLTIVCLLVNLSLAMYPFGIIKLAFINSLYQISRNKIKQCKQE
jgi:hypothetical protein